MTSSIDERRRSHKRHNANNVTNNQQESFNMNEEINTSVLNYNEEARKLWDRLGIDRYSREGGRYNVVDPIYKDPGGGTVFVGGCRAARDRERLIIRGVTSVVNCTADIPNFHDDELDYFDFDVTYWKRRCTASDPARLKEFVWPMINFVESAVQEGGGVLVHCLAGAHRAGTTGIICLMHFGGLSASDAECTARSLRPVIDPIGDFRELLRLCDELPRDKDGRFQYWT